MEDYLGVYANHNVGILKRMTQYSRDIYSSIYKWSGLELTGAK